MSTTIDHLAEITIPFLLAWFPNGDVMVSKSHTLPARVSQSCLLLMAQLTPSGDTSKSLRYRCRSVYL